MLKNKLLFPAGTNTPLAGSLVYGTGRNNVLSGSAGTTTYLTPISAEKVWDYVAAEQNCAYYIKADGTLWYTGEPGGSVLPNVTTLTKIGSDKTWKQVACNWNCSIAIRTDGTLWSWGSNSNGSTGQGTTVGNTSFATQVGTDTDWDKISCGFYASYAIKTDGTLWSWGSNTSYATGLGVNTGTTTVPTQITGASTWAILGRTAYNCGFAIRTDGTLWSWGNGASYQLGSGATSDVGTPTQVGSATDWIAIGNAGDSTNMATVGIRSSAGNNTLWSVGSNVNGLTGQGLSSGFTTTFTQVGSATDWTAVSGGSWDALAGIAGTHAYAWGSNLNGLTSQGTTSGSVLSPASMGGGTWSYITGGIYVTMALSLSAT